MTYMSWDKAILSTSLCKNKATLSKQESGTCIVLEIECSI